MTKDSHLQTEILEQPEALRRLLHEERDTIERVAEAIRQRNPRYIMLVARGSSDNAGRYGQYLFGAANHLPVALATPSLFTLYESPPRMSDSLVLAISQSGQSPDIVAVVDEGRRQGALTIALTNDSDSPLAQTADHVIHLHAGQEWAVAATKTYTTSLMALAMLSSALAGSSERFEVLAQVPDHLARVTQQADTIIKASERYRYMDACVVVSRGYNYATSYEIALKLKELTYILAEPYSSADFKHGPVALVAHGFPVVAVVPQGKLAAELTSFLSDLRERGAELIVVSAHEAALQLAQTPLRLPGELPEWASPIVNVVPGQLFALGLTMAKGYDVDQPRNIQKVTRTK
ncbi:MAG: SIS domain-containing protein [Anaerolineae bacterium]|nr:SIS domain-containing protein [Anaerolineae bacterium]